MAAAVLESVTVPRPSSGFQRAPPSSPRAAMVSSVSSGHRMGPLPEFRGLRIARRPVKAVSVSESARTVRRGVVCEAQPSAKTTAVGDVPDVTTETWKSVVLDSNIPVLIDFWAPWCGPCRMILPVVVELSKQYAGKLKCVKLNTDENAEIATQLGIRSIPTIMIFKNGEKKEAVIGAVPKSTLESSIEKFL